MLGEIINVASQDFKIVIVRLDRTIQHLLKRLDSPIKSGNDRHGSFIYQRIASLRSQ